MKTSPPQAAPTAQLPIYSQTVDYSQGATGETVIFQLSCVNVPVGSLISFTCPKVGPEPLLQLPWTTVTSAPFAAGITTQIPANFTGQITYLWDANGLPLPANMSLVLRALGVVPASHPDYEQATPLAELGLTASQLRELGQADSAKAVVKILQPATGTNVGSHLLTQHVQWEAALLGNASGTQAVSLATPSQLGAVQTVSFSADAPPAGATLAAALALYTGSTGGQSELMVSATNVPVGCAIALSGGTKDYPFTIAQTTINSSPFMTALNFPDVPAGLHAPLQLSFWQNGQILPADASLAVQFLQLEPSTGGPIQAVVLGQVVVSLPQLAS